VQREADSAGQVTPARGAGVRIRLFDADRTDRTLSLEEALEAKPSARQLLWIDVAGEAAPAEWRALADRFELDAETARALGETGTQPRIQLHDKHFHLRVAAEPDPSRRQGASWLDLVAGPNVVISQHHDELGFLGGINDQIAADATIGDLDSAEFVASVLDSIVTTYHAAIDGLEDELDEIDSRALAGRHTDEQFGRLVTIRRRIARLRRLLAAHRELFSVLGRRDFGRGIESADPEVFLPVAARFEGAILSLESTRDVVLGSFDVLMTRAAQRTNDIMRTLTLVTVMAVPATITAGFLGMNVIVPVSKDDPGSFWLIVVLVLVLEAAILAIARWRRWI
jgi:magnesium transporter